MMIIFFFSFLLKINARARGRVLFALISMRVYSEYMCSDVVLFALNK